MQDRFKFRFWHKPTNKMVDCYGFNEDFVFGDTLDGVGTVYNPAKFKDCILMQSTGLKDKNGKLIYEGDIFKTQEFCRGKEYYCYSVIKYSDGGYYLEGSYVTSGNTLKFINYDIRNISEDLLESGLFDLVGNIYENPELLEVEQWEQWKK